jgi:magnesium chelatase subunit H
MKRIVLIAGFESFNADLYRKAAHLATVRCPELDIRVFSDISLSTEPEAVEEALQDADVFFGSLIFDYDQVLWLRERVQHIPNSPRLRVSPRINESHSNRCLQNWG